MQNGQEKRPGKNLRPKDAGPYTGFAVSTLAKMRLRGDGPPYTKAGQRVVIYNTADIDDWLDANKRQSTSGAGVAA